MTDLASNVRRQPSPLISGSEGVEVEQGRTIYDAMADLDYTRQSDQIPVIDLIALEQFIVVTKVTQEPVQLPESFGGAVETASEAVAGKRLGLERGEHDGEVRLLGMPAI